MSKTDIVSPLRQRMVEDMVARKPNPHTQRSHIYSCKRFAAWLKRSPDTATADEVRQFQPHLIESGASICNRNRIMTGPSPADMQPSRATTSTSATERSACWPASICSPARSTPSSRTATAAAVSAVSAL